MELSQTDTEKRIQEFMYDHSPNIISQSSQLATYRVCLVRHFGSLKVHL